VKSAARLLVAALAALLIGATARAAPTLALPVDCKVGKSCIVQNYVDDDPGPDARDYRCGFLTYDGHKGTDIRVIDAGALRNGVAVLAAAPGRVRAVRDGMQDVSVRTIGKAAIAGREAGNSVVIEHGDGWETQYAHMRKGSVAVRAGDVVTAGQKLGLVGLSGNTEFPHVHFEIRHDRKTVDPFAGADAAEACGAGGHALWKSDALEALAYVATGVLDAGIAGAAPVVGDGNVDRDRTERFTPGSAAAVFWVQIYGARADDIEEFRLVAPDGRVISGHRDRIARNQAQWLAYAGRKGDGAAWTPGIYRGEYALYRGREKLISLTRETKLAPQAASRGDPGQGMN
jgi:murein DD-endopeptidase MepM/ murein hydrolase activator NlpD